MSSVPGSPFQPSPAGYDPRGFAVGVLANRGIEARGLRLRQWRWVYGSSLRENPFEEHAALAGRFMDLRGTLDGFYPGDHKGCLCSVEPVYVTATGSVLSRVQRQALAATMQPLSPLATRGLPA